MTAAQLDNYAGWSKSAADCLAETTRLAQRFYHATVDVPHLIAAMTLVPSALPQLHRRNIDVISAFRAAMTSLIEMERVQPGDPVAESSTNELEDMLDRAAEIAKVREQEISIDDLINALNTFPSTSPSLQLIRGGQKPDLKGEILSAVKAELAAFSEALRAAIQGISVPAPQPPIDFQARSDLNDIKLSLADIRSDLNAASRESARSIPDNVLSALSGIHEALRNLTTQLGLVHEAVSPPRLTPEANENERSDTAGWWFRKRKVSAY